MNRPLVSLLAAGLAAGVLTGCETLPQQAETQPAPVALIDADAALAVVPLCTPSQLADPGLALDTTGRFSSRVYRTPQGLCKPPSADGVPVDRALFENAFAGQIESGRLQVKPVERGICLVLDGAGFYSGGAKVRPHLDKLLEQVAWVTEHVNADLTIVGYTDDVPVNGGRFGSNQALSEARAESAASVLRSLVSDPTRIRFEGRGEREPVADNESTEGRARNRRVEVLIEPREATPIQ